MSMHRNVLVLFTFFTFYIYGSVQIEINAVYRYLNDSVNTRQIS